MGQWKDGAMKIGQRVVMIYSHYTSIKVMREKKASPALDTPKAESDDAA